MCVLELCGVFFLEGGGGGVGGGGGLCIAPTSCGWSFSPRLSLCLLAVFFCVG